MNPTNDRKRLVWQCRRGMLELDVILQPFLNKYFDGLDSAQKASFSELLKQADPDLYTWIMGFGECQHVEFKDIISLIRKNMNIA